MISNEKSIYWLKPRLVKGYKGMPGNFVPSCEEPRATRSRHKSCGAQQDVIPPSIRLDEPTALNKERVGQGSKAWKCGNLRASSGSSRKPQSGEAPGSEYAEDI